MAKQKAKAASRETFDPFEFIHRTFAQTQEEMSRGAGAGWRPAAKYPKATVHDKAAQLCVSRQLENWGKISPEQVRLYAAGAGMAQTFCTIAKGGRQPDDSETTDYAAWSREASVPPGGSHGHPEVCAAIVRLHDKGLMEQSWKDIWNDFPDFAKARALQRPEDVKADAAATPTDKPAAHDSDIDRSMARQREKMKWLAEAMTLVQEKPHLSDATIAGIVKRHPTTLSRSRTYQSAAAMAREHPRPPKGSKNKDGELEAESERDDFAEME